ncbi:MAG: GDSL-type esterase/lipase family protein, partial [Verrucomicrobia bacterium]|nr:GDSL-type esterase/lipase family protein [Verrucomicrobiota bacterium]
QTAYHRKYNRSAKALEATRRAGELTAQLADGKQVFWLDVNHVFLCPDGTINTNLMPDLIHPNAAGAEAWAQAIEPTLAQLMGDKPLAVDTPANSALIPVPKLENDSYDWHARHADVLRIKDSINPEVVLIGDSITHFWGGEPKANHVNGPLSWQSAFGKYRTLNLGFGWDRIQNVLWRIDHGELDGLHPRVIVLHIGTNNTSETPNARQNTPAEIAEGVSAILRRIRAKTPHARIILMAVFPREQKPDHPRRAQISEINRLLAPFGKLPGITLLDIGPKLLQPDGTLSREIMADFCHPTDKGYQIWADALQPVLAAGSEKTPLLPPGPELNLRLTAPIKTWDEALPLGNGTMGVLLWGEGNLLRLSLDRGDLWDERPSKRFTEVRDKFNWATMQQLVASNRMAEFNDIYDSNYDYNGPPTKLPAGRVEITLEPAQTVEAFELNLATAEGIARLKGGGAARALVNAAAVDNPVAIVRIDGPPLKDIQLKMPDSVKLLGYPAPRTGEAEGLRWFEQEAADGFSYAICAGWKRAGNATLVALTVSTRGEGKSPQAVAK